MKVNAKHVTKEIIDRRLYKRVIIQNPKIKNILIKTKLKKYTNSLIHDVRESQNRFERAGKRIK